MKKKIVIFTLCFTLIFSSLNIKKSYANPIVLTPQVMGVISAYAIGSSIIINSADEIVNLSHSFYNHFSDNWDSFIDTFTNGVTIAKDKIVNISGDVVSYLDDFFTVYFSDRKVTEQPLIMGGKSYIGVLSDYNISSLPDKTLYVDLGLYGTINGTDYGQLLYFVQHRSGTDYYDGFVCGGYRVRSASYHVPSSGLYVKIDNSVSPYGLYVYDGYSSAPKKIGTFNHSGSFPLGTYNPDKVNDNLNEDGSLGVYVPGNLSDLVGAPGGSTIYDGVNYPSYDLPVDGSVSMPGVLNPSVDYDSLGTFNPSIDGDVPGIDSPSVPSEGIWTTIKDFIISLVVPSSSFWTDTWGGLYNNFTDSFPMVDMSGFDDLVTGEKKFPNIDIDIMGVTGRVVNGDVINSIVNWLRPIIAGFMMICLMLFNYRKIYKLVRNSEPFEGVGKVENHAN